MKIRILLKSYLQVFFQDFLYLTMLFGMIVVGLTAESLFNISPVKKYSLLLMGAFFLALFSTMHLYYNDSRQNKYLKQKVASYWADTLSQFLVAIIVNLFSGILIFIFSLILNRDVMLDTVGILTLVAVGFLGSSIATLFKTQWGKHSSLGQVGILIFVYLALSGSVIGLLEPVDWIFPPLSKLIVTLQTSPEITELLPIAGQTFLYGLVLFAISSLIYKKK